MLVYLAACLRILTALGFILAAWKWADWKNWKNYYPTYLFFMTLSFMTEFVTYKHTLWNFCPTLFLPNHTVGSLFYAFTVYPATVLLFLSQFPKKCCWRQASYVALWVGIYSSIEAVALVVGGGSYYNGWTLWWSILVNVILFPTLRVHYSNPLLAWLMGGLFSILILVIFGFSLSDFK